MRPIAPSGLGLPRPDRNAWGSCRATRRACRRRARVLSLERGRHAPAASSGGVSLGGGMPNTLIGIFLETVSTYRKPDQFMRKSASGWESISGERALADVEGLALALRELGVRRGDRVAILSENRYEWPVTDLAILGLGAVTVPIYPTVTAAQCRHIVGNSEASVAIVSSASQLAKMREAAMGLATLRTVIVIDP